MPDAPPIGQRFSQVYLQRGEPAEDSERMRRRLSATIQQAEFLKEANFPAWVTQQLGVDVPWTAGMYGRD